MFQHFAQICKQHLSGESVYKLVVAVQSKAEASFRQSGIRSVLLSLSRGTATVGDDLVTQNCTKTLTDLLQFHWILSVSNQVLTELQSFIFFRANF